ncbi:MAG: polyketide synthase, partial [Chlamydiales bacterium]|nr:polyketide synthase [Chlamydiales bacterium]
MYSGLEIAVIGMACEFKNSDNYHRFWQQLKNGVECIDYYSDDELRQHGVEPALIDNPSFVKINPHLTRRDYFDYPFFGLHVREAQILNAQARLLLENAWSALEDAGYLPQELRGKVGVFCGANSSLDYEIHSILQQYSHISPMETSLLADKNYIATRLAYHYNFTGPAICVDTACSTSLVAIHLACQALLSGDCDMALAGGATILPDDTHGYLYQEGMIYSRDGHTRSFDADATGTINSEGAGMVVLKILDKAIKDKDHIHGIIRSTAVNNDGRRKV